MARRDIYRTIAALCDQLDKLDEQSKGFIEQQRLRIAETNGLATFSPAQMRYVYSLAARFLGRIETDAPKSKLQELRERKAKLKKLTKKERERSDLVHAERAFVVEVGDGALRSLLNGGGEPVSYHDRERRRQRILSSTENRKALS
jgi:hypothetical protein